MQSSRERVIRTLKFEYPDRVPRQAWHLPWFKENFPVDFSRLQEEFPDDIIFSVAVYEPSAKVNGNQFQKGTYCDEWGCIFENLQDGIIGEVREPILTDLKDLSKIQPPYDTIPENQDKARDEVNRYCSLSDRFILAQTGPRPWERYQFLRGSENAMIDLMTERDQVKKALKLIHDFYMKELEFWVKTDVDGIMFLDDWGSQNSLLISPKIWRELFRPLYQDFADIAHQNGKFLFMHSDGNIMQIYQDLIEIGIDAVNSQLFVMDMNELKETAKGKITFWGEIDRQHVLISEDESVVREAVRKVANHLYDPAGGIIAQFELGLGTYPSNGAIIFDEWNKISEEHKITK